MSYIGYIFLRDFEKKTFSCISRQLFKNVGTAKKRPKTS